MKPETIAEMRELVKVNINHKTLNSYEIQKMWRNLPDLLDAAEAAEECASVFATCRECEAKQVAALTANESEITRLEEVHQEDIAYNFELAETAAALYGEAENVKGQCMVDMLVLADENAELLDALKQIDYALDHPDVLSVAKSSVRGLLQALEEA